VKGERKKLPLLRGGSGWGKIRHKTKGEG